MSEGVFENDMPGRMAGWGTSLVLHGLLGGLILLAMGIDKPLPPEPFRWNVALLQPPPPSSGTQAQAAAPSASQRRIVAPKPVVDQKIAPDAPAVTETVTPIQQETVVSVSPAASATEQAASHTPADHTSSAVVDTGGLGCGVGPCGGGGDSEAPQASVVVDTGELAHRLWRRMEELKRYPYLARRNGWEGQVLINAVIGTDGHLLHAEIQQSSGHKILDQDALKVIRAATPLSMGQSHSQQQTTFTIPLIYRLRH